MGKGDKKTKRGKIIMGSSGVIRKKKRKIFVAPTAKKKVKKAKEEAAVEEIEVKKPAAKKKATTAKATEDKKTTKAKTTKAAASAEKNVEGEAKKVNY